MLRHLRHACRTAGVEIRAHAVTPAVGKLQRGWVFRQLFVEVFEIRVLRACDFGPDKRHNPGLWRGQVFDQINFQNRVHMRGMAHGLSHLLGHVGFWEAFKRHHHFCVGFAQDGRDLLRLQKRVDRIHNARNHTTKQRIHGLVTVRQHKGHSVFFTYAKIAEHVGRLGGLGVQLGPSDSFGFVFGAGENLIADRRTVWKLVLGVGQHLIDRGRVVPLIPRFFILDGFQVCQRFKAHSLFSPLGMIAPIRQTSASLTHVGCVPSR
mmetsp:Transcript_7158/g.11772  ORF Transcript_7158/g.11772 Transcript_7158/m.11772 type:complete len:264 (+) Transcript_7158:1253-2044(+)